jgi:hypothetical protein
MLPFFCGTGIEFRASLSFPAGVGRFAGNEEKSTPLGRSGLGLGCLQGKPTPSEQYLLSAVFQEKEALPAQEYSWEVSASPSIMSSECQVPQRHRTVDWACHLRDVQRPKFLFPMTVGPFPSTVNTDGDGRHSLNSYRR